MQRFNKIIGNIIPEQEKRDGDYYGEDGLLYCEKCRTKKESRINLLDLEDDGQEEKETIVPVMCRCRKEKREEEDRKRRYEKEMRRIESLRKGSLIEEKFKNVRFSNYRKTQENQKVYSVARKYVTNFQKMLQENQGLLFWGMVGTGKSHIAACIANELLTKRVTVIMTSFVKILQEIQKPQTDESEFMAKLNSPTLLIIDDLGTERDTSYALEKVYNIIDSRYRLKKPIILTTNLSLLEMQETTDVRYKRIYDRIFEMCYPVLVPGKSWREQEAAIRYDRMKKMMEE